MGENMVTIVFDQCDGRKTVQIEDAQLDSTLTNILDHPETLEGGTWFRENEWGRLPPRFHANLVGITDADDYCSGDVVYTSPMIEVMVFDHNLVGVRMDTSYSVRRRDEDGIFRAIETPEECEVLCSDRGHKLEFSIDRQRKVYLDCKDSLWGRIIADPDKYRGLMILEYLVTPDDANPLTALLATPHSAARFTAETLRSLIEEAKEALEKIVV